MARPARRTLVLVLAGGKGSRLAPLTLDRAKPAVPFAGRYRIIDFVLSNLVNSGYPLIHVLTQYMAGSLIQHLHSGWSGADGRVEVVPAQMRTGERWFAGTADAVFQNLCLVRDARPERVVVFGGDHVYSADVAPMEAAHRERGAALTIAALAVPRGEADRFGVIEVDAGGRVQRFTEKPPCAAAPEIPGRPGTCLASMGNYIFETRPLVEALLADARAPGSGHDFGRDVIPQMLREGLPIYAHDLAAAAESRERPPYWRDVGTLESYFDANMDFLAAEPPIDLGDRAWPIRSAPLAGPPPRIGRLVGEAPATIEASMICAGAAVSSATLRRAIIGQDATIRPRALLEEAIVLSESVIGAGARLRRVIVDRRCVIDPGVVIGEDPEADRRRFPFVSEAGIVVLSKGTRVPLRGPITLGEAARPAALAAGRALGRERPAASA